MQEWLKHKEEILTKKKIVIINPLINPGIIMEVISPKNVLFNETFFHLVSGKFTK